MEFPLILSILMYDPSGSATEGANHVNLLMINPRNKSHKIFPWYINHGNFYTSSYILLAKLSHLYKIVNELADYPNAPLLPKMHHYNSRRTNSRQFVQHRARTTQFQRSFFSGHNKEMEFTPCRSFGSTIFSKFQEIYIATLIFVIAFPWLHTRVSFAIYVCLCM